MKMNDVYVVEIEIDDVKYEPHVYSSVENLKKILTRYFSDTYIESALNELEKYSACGMYTSNKEHIDISYYITKVTVDVD